MGAVARDHEVFLNVPYDRRYERRFVTLVAGVVALGRVPRCTLEIPDTGPGQNRLERIWDLINGCAVSFHDLSRVGTTNVQVRGTNCRLPRFNMPFELGMAYAHAMERRAQRASAHRLFVLETMQGRLEATLSDWKHDHKVYDGTQPSLLRCLTDCIGTGRKGEPTPTDMIPLVRGLARANTKLKVNHQATLPYHASLFRRLVVMATNLAVKHGFLSG